jgi:hypothetical protein
VYIDRIVSTRERKSNHFNLGVLCDYYYFFLLLWDPEFSLGHTHFKILLKHEERPFYFLFLFFCRGIKKDPYNNIVHTQIP